MTNSLICKTCRKPKASFECGICHEPICKACAEFVGEEKFSYLKEIPAELKHPTYCSNCFDDKVSGPLELYNETVERAKDIYIFTKEQAKLTSRLNKKEDPYKVENCEDEQEAIMRMSFFAVQDNFNALVDLKLTSKKIIVGSHKKTIWDGTAIPVKLDPNAIPDDSWNKAYK